MKTNFTQQKGFTLVETLVAIAIFTVSIVGLLAVITQGITNTNYVKKKIAAEYLAQEGIEYMHNMRDTYMLYDSTSPQAGWDKFNSKLTTAGASCQSANGCYFNPAPDYASSNQPITNIAVSVCTPTCPELKFDSATGTYSYTGSGLTGLIRTIKVSTVNANETKITSTVSWTQGSGPKSVSLSEDVFNWIQ